jgi:UDP-N-acetylglucosamine transferase subunit ALG13
VILVTVGSMMPFDRLIRSADGWAERHPEEDVLAQIGSGTYTPLHMRAVKMLSPEELRERLQESRIVIGHAGMGTIIMALELQKPLIVLPRLQHLGEHTTDHQVATAKKFQDRAGIFVAWDEKEAVDALSGAWVPACLPNFPNQASSELLDCIRKFIDET